MHTRAKHFNDKTVAAKNLATKDPSQVKKFSYSVHGYTGMEWSKVRENRMLKLLRVKFARGTDLAAKLQSTENRLLAESGKDNFFLWVAIDTCCRKSEMSLMKCLSKILYVVTNKIYNSISLYICQL